MFQWETTTDTRWSIATPENRARMVFELCGAAYHPGNEFFYDGWCEALEVLEDYLA